jgi:hypothetical protein
MCRKLRITANKGIVDKIDIGKFGTGKIFLYNTGTLDMRIAYDRFDVGTTGVNYFTLLGGSQYVFDVSNSVGFLAQNQQMYFVSPVGDQVLEVWEADNQ